MSRHRRNGRTLYHRQITLFGVNKDKISNNGTISSRTLTRHLRYFWRYICIIW